MKRCPPFRWMNYFILWVKSGSVAHIRNWIWSCHLLAHLQNHFEKVVGIDFSIDIIQYARQRLQNHPNAIIQSSQV